MTVYVLPHLMTVRFDRTAAWDRQWVLYRRDREVARFATYTEAKARARKEAA